MQKNTTLKAKVCQLRNYFFTIKNKLMEKTNILNASFLDILFEGRNKIYGAYELRMNYEKRMWKAFGITLLLILLIGAGAYFKNSHVKQSNAVINISPDINISSITPEPEEAEIIQPLKPEKQVAVVQVQTIKLTTPVIVDNDEIIPPPAQDDLRDARISNVTQDGVKDNNIALLPSHIDGNRGIVIDVRKQEPENSAPFVKVEIDAKYPGGASAWRNFLERNLRGETPVDNGASYGTYTVIIQFVVDKNGNVSDAKPLTNFGFGMEAEAIRVIKKSGKWLPAIQNGAEVKAYRKQPIIFQVLEQ